MVTYNRKALLAKCISALQAQSRRPELILVIDNASTDGTRAMLREQGWLTQPHIQVVALDTNTGGAGGFAEGMRFAMQGNTDWLWMMDDDAEPRPTTLKHLMSAVEDDNAIYGSIAVANNGRLCWPLFSIDGVEFDVPDRVPTRVNVPALPFLGILIPRKIIETIGYPDAGYFIAGDDTEYCFRAHDFGFPVIAVGKSRLNHPASQFYRFGLGPWAPVCFRIAPWKRYYDVRNRILTSWKHGAWHVWTRSIPAALLRLLATMINEPSRLAQLRAYASGMVDGIARRKGMRHQIWGNKS